MCKLDFLSQEMTKTTFYLLNLYVYVYLKVKYCFYKPTKKPLVFEMSFVLSSKTSNLYKLLIIDMQVITKYMSCSNIIVIGVMKRIERNCIIIL